MELLDRVRGEGYLVRRTLGPDDDPTTAVVEAALSLGVDFSDQAAELNEFVDPDALNRIFESKFDGTPRRGGGVLFEAWGLTVFVTRDAVEVYDPDAVASTRS